MKIAIFAAGTGGHIYPALSIAENFKKDEVLFFASNRELEKQIYAVTNFKVIHLKVSGFRGKSLLEKIVFPFNLLINLFKVIFELIKFCSSSLIIFKSEANCFLSESAIVPILLNCDETNPFLPNRSDLI